MSNIAYFTTSPAMLMRQWKASCGIYDLDIYIKGNLGPFGTNCDCDTCPACEDALSVIYLEYDDGSGWADTGFNVNASLSTTCSYLSTISINTCSLTTYKFRITMPNYCPTSPFTIKFNYTINSSTCPSVGDCASGVCTSAETANLIPSITSNTSIAISICQDCSSNCITPCCSSK